MVDPIILYKGQYTGKVTDIHYLEGLVLGTTIYPPGADGSSLHYHENPHISILLEGGHVERRINAEFTRLPGDILFCHGGETHQFLTKQFPSKNINLEIDYPFLHQHELSENSIYEAVKENLNAKFLILRMYKESVIQDNLSETSIHMLLLSLVNDINSLNNKRKPKWVLLLLDILNDRWSEWKFRVN